MAELRRRAMAAAMRDLLGIHAEATYVCTVEHIPAGQESPPPRTCRQCRWTPVEAGEKVANAYCCLGARSAGKDAAEQARLRRALILQINRHHDQDAGDRQDLGHGGIIAVCAPGRLRRRCCRASSPNNIFPRRKNTENGDEMNRPAWMSSRAKGPQRARKAAGPCCWLLTST